MKFAPRLRLCSLRNIFVPVLVFFLSQGIFAADRPLRIGSKKFTESYVLGEIAKGALTRAGLAAEHRQGMGGTIILWQALKAGEIDAYPEYTGTIAEEILKNGNPDQDAMRTGLAAQGIGMGGELGFNNTYALVVTKATAARLNLRALSDLKNHGELRYGLTHEFLGRADGWRPLAARYGLDPAAARGIDHALGYAALQSGELEVKDAYSTDAKLAEYDLVTLRDDLNYFPRYRAVFLYRLEMAAPAQRVLVGLAGTLDETRMIKLNAAAESAKDYAAAAALYFHDTPIAAQSWARRIAGWTARHLLLTGAGLLLAILFGLPLGLLASRPGPLGHLILALCNVLQTIPALALLALLVPLPFFGISPRTAIAALFLYALLPIVRGTAVGLQSIPPALREAAAALGLEPAARLRKIYLPMAARPILAGIQTSAVITVGTATLASLIGAGGLGEPIVSGLNLNDLPTLLAGAIPAALLALAVQGLFAGLERLLISPGLRLEAGH